MTLVHVGLGFMAFVTATTLAIDVGMFMTARSQAQIAADAGALAGATALGFNSFDDRTVTGPAVQSAINTATANQVMTGAPSVLPADVTFPVGSNGTFNRVKVDVFRTSPRSNPLPTLMGSLFGVDTVDISATATAEAAPANAIRCVKPFTIPDKWHENRNPAWTVNSTFDRYDNKGDLLSNADEYVPSDGYSDREIGMVMTIRAGGGNNIAPSMYWSWKMPGSDIGGDYYRENIANCNQAVFKKGYVMTQEPGDMSGPTMQGIDDLMAKDPYAEWDPVAKMVKSKFNPSPRIFPIPLYDPDEYQKGKETGRNATLVMTGWLGFFLEGRSGNQVFGRVVRIHGEIDPNAPAAETDSLAVAIRLVK